MSFSLTEYVDRQALNKLFTTLPKERNQTPGTVKAYIGSYLSFLQFLFLEKEIGEEETARARMCVEAVRKTISKEAACRQFKVQERDADLIISNEDILVITPKH